MFIFPWFSFDFFSPLSNILKLFCNNFSNQTLTMYGKFVLFSIEIRFYRFSAKLITEFAWHFLQLISNFLLFAIDKMPLFVVFPFVIYLFNPNDWINLKKKVALNTSSNKWSNSCYSWNSSGSCKVSSPLDYEWHVSFFKNGKYFSKKKLLHIKTSGNFSLATATNHMMNMKSCYNCSNFSFFCVCVVVCLMWITGNAWLLFWWNENVWRIVCLKKFFFIIVTVVIFGMHKYSNCNPFVRDFFFVQMWSLALLD